ncbi:hypothetical protein M0R45_005998 [Rubus argutus]|uniref:Leucine-rich repeat-containing N-terminal plant-type domain-containing protein n=1 Tax=Rubus argutus TaxID=59490 RepID=A0AAW1YPP4_RUBAR
MWLHVPNLWAFWFIYLHVITLVLLMNRLHPTTLVKALGNETDRFSLLKFKEAIATDPHGFLNSWNYSLHFCNWHGITCSTRHQRVVALNLSRSDLHGTISPFIGNLSFLRFINLRHNNFSGKIPQQVDHLFRLRHLLLSYNMLEGGYSSQPDHLLGTEHHKVGNKPPYWQNSIRAWFVDEACAP